MTFGKTRSDQPDQPDMGLQVKKKKKQVSVVHCIFFHSSSFHPCSSRAKGKTSKKKSNKTFFGWDEGLEGKFLSKGQENKRTLSLPYT